MGVKKKCRRVLSLCRRPCRKCTHTRDGNVFRARSRRMPMDPNHPAPRETPSIGAPSPASESPPWPPKRNARVMYICGLAFAPIPLRPRYGLGEGFLTFFRPKASLFSEGKFSPNLPPAGLVAPIQPGDPLGIVDGRGTDAPATSQKPTTWSLGSKYVWPNHWLRRRASSALSGAPSDPAERKS